MSNSEQVTVDKTCYYAFCEFTPKWGVSSKAEVKNPDGSDLTLYTCDTHYDDLTGKLRSVGTKYNLFPVNGPHMVAPREEPTVDDFKDPDALPEPRTRLGRFLLNAACVVVGIIIGPFILIYYASRWLLGFRPSDYGSKD